MREEGFGREAVPPHKFQSDIATSSTNEATQAGPAWDEDQHQLSEEPNMSSGATKPTGMGQRSIFGGGARPVFAQMPSYTPVTRGGEQPQVRPAAPSYSAYANSPAPSHPAPQPAQPQNYSDPMPSAPQNHQGYAQAEPAASYQPAPHQPAPQNPPQSYSTQAYPAESYPPQNYQQESYPSAQPYSGQHYPSQPQAPQSYQPSYRDASFPEAGDADASFADASFSDGNFPDGSFPDPNYADASFPESNGGDVSFPEDLGYQADASFAQDAPLDLGAPNVSFGGGQQVPPLPSYAGMQQGGGPSYGQPGEPMSGRQVAAYQAGYEQPPQISLGAPQGNRPAQNFYESEQPDADFLGEAAIAAKETAKVPRISSLRNRSMVMVGAALLGAVALGGALAFAYKQSGGGTGQPPLVQADNRPVKEAPDQPGGKDFPHKNKLIYDRLQNGDQPEADRLVPRQEELAMPSMPGATAAIPGADGAPQTTQSVDTPTPVASTDDPTAAAAEDGGPRRVKTMKVTADGAVVEAEVPAEVASAEAPAAAEAQPQLAATAPAMPPAPEAAPAAAPAPAAPAEPAEVAAVAPAPAAKPKPAPKPVAAAEPAPQAAPAKPVSYVVQLGSKKDQTEALASFADMQQKYPTLLANYRPMVQKADLGSKGTWYRLRVGPIADKGTASKLCSQLKAQGQADCMVASQ